MDHKDDPLPIILTENNRIYSKTKSVGKQGASPDRQGSKFYILDK